MQRRMLIFLLTFVVELHAKDVVTRRQSPQPSGDLPGWLRHPEDWPDDPTAPPPDPKLIKRQADVKKLLSSVKRAGAPKQQWQLAASINDKPSNRHAVVLPSLKIGRKHARGQTSQEEVDKQDSAAIISQEQASPPGLFRPPPEHFHAAQELFSHPLGFESHLAGLKGHDDTPDEFLWKNLSDFKPPKAFNSTFWQLLCAHHGAGATGIWKEVCSKESVHYWTRFKKTICSDDVKAIAEGDTEHHCAVEVAKDKECSKVFYFIPDKASPECKCVKKDKLCKPADNDKGGTVYFLE